MMATSVHSVTRGSLIFLLCLHSGSLFQLQLLFTANCSVIHDVPRLVLWKESLNFPKVPPEYQFSQVKLSQPYLFILFIVRMKMIPATVPFTLLIWLWINFHCYIVAGDCLSTEEEHFECSRGEMKRGCFRDTWVNALSKGRTLRKSPARVWFYG